MPRSARAGRGPATPRSHVASARGPLVHESRPRARPFSPFEGAEDLNDPAALQLDGVLFMEGENEPTEITRLKRDLRETAEDSLATGEWLASAMQASWDVATALLDVAELADLLGDRHRIIANDWQAADMSALAGRLLVRARTCSIAWTSPPLRCAPTSRPPLPHLDCSTPRASSSPMPPTCSSDSAGLVHDNEPLGAASAPGWTRSYTNWTQRRLGRLACRWGGKRGKERLRDRSPPTTERHRSETTPRAARRARPPRVGRVPPSRGLAPSGRGMAPGPDVPRVRGRRAHDGKAATDCRHGPDLRASHRRGRDLRGLGPNTDWIRNLRIAAAVEVRLGRQSFVPEQRFPTDDEAMAVALSSAAAIRTGCGS